MSNFFEQLKDNLLQYDVAKITSDLIKIKSYSFMEEQEKEVAEYIFTFFIDEGIECKKTEIRPGRYNVVAKLSGNAPNTAKSLALSGHMDTVPAYDMTDAFDGRIENGKVFGRGACDMKGPLASMMVAIAALNKSNIKLDGDLYFVAVADEEEQGRGTEYLIENWIGVDGIIIGEPNSMQIALGHKGLEWIEVEFHGKKVHGGDKENGVNAIEMAARFINKIYSEYVPLLNSREYPVLGKPTINIGTIEGGDQPSTVPDYCKLKLDRRCVPTETIEQVYAELENIANELNEEDSRFSATVKDVFEGEDLMAHLPFCMNEDDPLVVSIKDSLEKADVEEVVSVFPAWTDAGFIRANTGCSCIVMGPGPLSVAHSIHEYVDIKELEEAALVYALTAIDYCK